jgi:TolA-binding protein
VGTYFYQQSCEQNEQSSKTALYQIQKSVESESGALTEAEKTPGAKFDVDAKFPKTVADLNKIIGGKETARVKYEAAMKLGTMYMEFAKDDSLPKATDAFKKMTEFAKTSFQKSTAYYLLGNAHERASAVKEATDAFQSALNQGYEGMKGELLLSLVRVSLKANNPTQAKAFADKLNKEAPGTRAAQEAQKLISKT